MTTKTKTTTNAKPIRVYYNSWDTGNVCEFDTMVDFEKIIVEHKKELSFPKVKSTQEQLEKLESLVIDSFFADLKKPTTWDIVREQYPKTKDSMLFVEQIEQDRFVGCCGPYSISVETTFKKAVSSMKNNINVFICSSQRFEMLELIRKHGLELNYAVSMLNNKATEKFVKRINKRTPNENHLKQEVNQLISFVFITFKSNLGEYEIRYKAQFNKDIENFNKDKQLITQLKNAKSFDEQELIVAEWIIQKVEQALPFKVVNKEYWSEPAVVLEYTSDSKTYDIAVKENPNSSFTSKDMLSLLDIEIYRPAIKYLLEKHKLIK